MIWTWKTLLTSHDGIQDTVAFNSKAQWLKTRTLSQDFLKIGVVDRHGESAGAEDPELANFLWCFSYNHGCILVNQLPAYSPYGLRSTVVSSRNTWYGMVCYVCMDL